ncbi:unannotated protein [freshwater metagenome]|uniref:Unannotated protein n=1 Tax=freshwater metagenome TaxID=449393 RepID=A0A6J7HBT5_9ZZZZ
MNELSQTTGIVAVAAAVVALLALVLALVLWRSVRRLRADQRAVLGDERRDLVAHAAELDRQFRALHEWVIDVATRIQRRTDRVETRLNQTLAHTAVVRYDAYNEMTGHQSVSIALLDAERRGIVLSSIHHRDQARLYIKQVEHGQGSIPLTPEEEEAVRAALAREVPDRAFEAGEQP